jgi:hypothetical protein
MKIELHEVPVQDIVRYSKHLKECQGYVDKGEEGVYGMEGRLNIRPIYQREFIYGPKERDAVINTIKNNFPLNVLYWVENKDGSYEVLDGQQRLISIGQYVNNNFSIDKLGFHNLTDDQQDQILNYKLMVYFCEGSDSEKLDWFRIINIAGKKLTDQELRNAVYSGQWVSDAKRYFSRTGGPAYQICPDDYLTGVAKRQDYLETAIEWINNKDIEEYMSKHQHCDNAKELWEYFEGVINWTKKLLPTYRKEMKGVPFGLLYNTYADGDYDSTKIEIEIGELMQDEDVTKKSGIYSYIFTRDERELSIRTFSDKEKRETYERQSGVCVHCKESLKLDEMEADHITPWSKGGKTTPENCQMLCLKCNRTKSAK